MKTVTTFLHFGAFLLSSMTVYSSLNFIIIYVGKYLSCQKTMLINTDASLILLFSNFIRW